VSENKPADDTARALDLERLEQLPGFYVARTDQDVRRVIRSVLARHNLTRKEFALMILVDANPGVSLGQLGEALDIAGPNIAVLVDRLAKRGLVESQRSTSDGRVRQLFVTTRGGAALRRTETAIHEAENRIFNALSPAERRQLRQLLEKVRTTANRIGSS